MTMGYGKKRRYSKLSSSRAMASGPSGIGKTGRFKLRCVHQCIVVSGADGIDKPYIVFLGSLFNPFGSSSFNTAEGNIPITHQPLGYDQLANVYDRYIVHSCSVELSMQNASLSTAMVTIFPITVATDGVTTTANAQEQPGATHVLMEAGNGTTSTSTPKKMTRTFNLAGIQGLTNSKYGNIEAYSGSTAGGDPTNFGGCSILVRNGSSLPLGSSTTIPKVAMTIRLSFDVTFYEPKTLAASN